MADQVAARDASGSIADRARYGLTTALAIALVVWLVAGPESATAYLLVANLIGGVLVVAAAWSSRADLAGKRVAVVGMAACIIAAGLVIGSENAAAVTTAIVLFAVALAVPWYVVVGLARRRSIDPQLVMGAVTIYLITGIAATMAFMLTGQAQDTPLFVIDGTPTDSSFRTTIYTSFVTLSTVGYGDVAPYSGSARAIAIFTALFGQLYLVTAVASAVSLLSAKRIARETAQ